MTFNGQSAWLDVAGYEGLYQVSCYGEVLSLRSGCHLKGSTVPGGYLTVALHKDGIQKTRTIHSLVASAHVPNPEGKPSINHMDSCKTNNRADNLEWCTPAENTQHGILFGNIRGAPKALSEDQAAQIRLKYEAGHRMKTLADEFEVSHSTIKNIIRGMYYPITHEILRTASQKVDA